MHDMKLGRKTLERQTFTRIRLGRSKCLSLRSIYPKNVSRFLDLALVALLASILLAAAVVSRPASAAPEATQGGSLQKEFSNSPSSTQAVNTGTALGIGDRLKISFLEMIDVASSVNVSKRDAVSPAMVHAFYQRMDLSGEYSVEPDGSIAIPRLGRFQVESRGLYDLQSDLVAAFVRTSGRSADVTVTIVERSPIYVVGFVKAPGSYKYAPGMMVLHAVALAGGLGQGMENAPHLVEVVREVERLRSAADEMKRLLARRARLEAERLGDKDLQPSAQLIAIAGERGTETLMEAERMLLQLERMKRHQQQAEAAAALEEARDELDVLKSKLAQLDVRKKIHAERLKQQEELMERGQTTRNSIVNSRSELADIDVRKQDYRLAIVQAEARLSQARRTAEKISLDNAGSILSAITATDAEIARTEMVLSSSETLSSILRAGAGAKLPQATPAYEIVRQGENGPVVLLASETSSLKPRDVLKVSLNGSASSNAIGAIGLK